MKRARSRWQRLVLISGGTLLFALGLAGDCGSGLLLLENKVGAWLFLHFPFVLAWAGGIFLLKRSASSQEQRDTAGSLLKEQWTVTGLLVGMLLVPGLGTLAYSLALLAGSWFFQRKTATEALPETLLMDDESPAPVALDLDIQPLVNHLQDTDLEIKRAAVSVLSQQATPEGTQILRQLLSDASAEVRSDASIALTRMDDEQSQRVNHALLKWQATPTSETARGLVDAYYTYINSNVLDETSQQAYLLKTRDLLQQILAKEPGDEQLWIKLAAVCQRMGQFEEALLALQRALRLQPALPELYAQAMELALLQGDWSALKRFAQQGLAILEPGNPLREAFTWWATSPAPHEEEERYEQAS